MPSDTVGSRVSSAVVRFRDLPGRRKALVLVAAYAAVAAVLVSLLGLEADVLGGVSGLDAGSRRW